MILRIPLTKKAVHPAEQTWRPKAQSEYMIDILASRAVP